MAMIELVCSAAHELVHRSLGTGHIAHARLGARVGRLVDPANEQMWRDALLAEHLAADPHGIEDIVAKLHAYLDSFQEDYEPEEETQELIDQLRRHGYPIPG